MANKQKNSKAGRMQGWCKAYASFGTRYKNKIKKMERTLKHQPNNETLASALKSFIAKGVAAMHRPASKYYTAK